ncbi:type II toxin-antitoxin system VapC family toxin [Pengzhenrongella sicca]|uniref:Type II toxin-antitoxin system VapC family toxin n=1 Tax=Pengzhenrongella sicca TaxID=2819238 RepID=A0A8A4ZE83_9MICO|nr:type II toxin-antitoxin system VapC family toxin [Pengzhenrongella sicca]QTE29213.1 type II toxin-antitoxin system VapC family toxin [Pengzhenrongella sicca]
MALVYFHPGALVRLCTPAAGSRIAAALWDGADTVVTSRLADLEVRAVLAGGSRIGKIDDPAHDRAKARWARLWLGLWTVELGDQLIARAAELAELHPLRVTDAVHLASALVLESPDLSVLSWDAPFSDAARAEGLRVLP